MTFFWPKLSSLCAQTQPDHERSVFAKVQHMNFAETFNIHWVVTPVQLKANLMKQQDEATWEYKQVESERTQRDSVKSYQVLRVEHTETFKHHSFFSPAQPWVENQSFFGGENGGLHRLDAVARRDLAHLKWWWKCESVRRGLTRRSQNRHWKKPHLRAPPFFFPVFTSFTVRVSLMHF